MGTDEIHSLNYTWIRYQNDTPNRTDKRNTAIGFSTISRKVISIRLSINAISLSISLSIYYLNLY